MAYFLNVRHIATNKVRMFQIFKTNIREANMMFYNDEILEQME